jgi:hypothetical protein
MSVKALTWSQVHSWRLSQHCLSPRLNRQDFLQAVTRTGGIQAQVLSAAELALWARVHELTRVDIQTALWQERSCNPERYCSRSGAPGGVLEHEGCDCL